jgi:drug/metabolite transporter (DMT)-like permease
MYTGVSVPNQSNTRAWLALAAVCFFWGTTYMGIRVSLETFPPLVLLSSRFILSGSLLLLLALATGQQFPKGKEWGWSVLQGFFTIGVGTGALIFAELFLPSSLAALLVSLGPFWMVGTEALLPGGEPLHKPAIGGMLVGLAGVLILVLPGMQAGGFSGPLWTGFLILQLSCAGWAFGSSLYKRHKTDAPPIVTGAVQQLGAGLIFAIPAWLAGGEIHWSGKGVGALLYLVVFGSMVGYSAYVYALRHLPVAVTSIYNYVNPIVAAAIGWLLYREPFGRKELAAMVVIFVGVAIVKSVTRTVTPPPAAATDSESEGFSAEDSAARIGLRSETLEPHPASSSR